jgi:hypothetical protein
MTSVCLQYAHTETRSRSESLVTLCLVHIARPERPKDYRFVESLLTDHYGMVVKRELRDQLDRDV